MDCPGRASAASAWWACQSDLDSTTVAQVMDNINAQYTLKTEKIPWFTSVTASVTFQQRVVAYPIQIKWKATDRTSTTTLTPTSEPKKHSGGLSIGAKAGIGVAVGLVALAITSFIVWWCLRKKSFPRSEEDRSLGHETSVYPKAEMDANAVAKFCDSVKPSEVVGNQV